jgi:hypothetical protein
MTMSDKEKAIELVRKAEANGIISEEEAAVKIAEILAS